MDRRGIAFDGGFKLQTFPHRHDGHAVPAEIATHNHHVARLHILRRDSLFMLDDTDPGPVWAADGRPRVVLVPGASRRGAIKRWPLRHWLTLAERLRGRCQLRWSLGPEEAALRAWLPEATGVPALPAAGLWTLAAALRQADRVVAPDTGLLHLAVVLGVPVLGLYGGSDPVVAGLPAGAGRILHTGIECSPCRERLCQRRQCLEELDPERVAAEI